MTIGACTDTATTTTVASTSVVDSTGSDAIGTEVKGRTTRRTASQNISTMMGEILLFTDRYEYEKRGEVSGEGEKGGRVKEKRAIERKKERKKERKID